MQYSEYTALDIVEALTTVLTFFLMACGIPSCLRMYQTRSTKNVPFFFFLVNAFVASFGTYYGLVIQNNAFILINTTGIVLWGLYIAVYVSVSKSKSKLLTYLLGAIAVLFLHGLYLRLFAPFPPALTNTLGTFLFIWSILLLLTPVLDIFDFLPGTTCTGAFAQSRSDPDAAGLMWFGLPLAYIASFAAWVFLLAYCMLSSGRLFLYAGLVFTLIRSKVSDKHLKMEIVKDGTSQGSDIAMLFGGTLCCIAWFLYGYLLNDVYVYGPNIVGLAVYTTKVATIIAYRSSIRTKIE